MKTHSFYVMASLFLLILTPFAEAVGYIDVTLTPASLRGDVYVDGALAAAQVNATHLSVAPGTPHLVEVKNVTDTTPGFGDVFVYGDVSQPYVTVGMSRTQSLTLRPLIKYLKGYLDFTCGVQPPQAGQAALCQVSADGIGLGVVNPGEKARWAVPIGQRAVHVDLVGEHAGLWTPPASDHTVTIGGGQVTYLRATYVRKGQLVAKWSVAGIAGDVYVDGQPIAGQAAIASTLVAPGNHTVEGRNLTDPGANGVYRYADVSSVIWIGANQTRTVTLYPQKQYLLGFGEITCRVNGFQAGQDVRCGVAIDGQGVGVIEAGQKQTYNLAPGAHAVKVSLTGGNADQWVSAAHDSSLSIVAGRTAYLAPTFNRKPAPSAAPAPAPIGRGGFELGGHIASFDYADKMHYAGMTWVKVQVHYGDDASGITSLAHANRFKIQLSALGSPGMVTQPNFASDFSAWVARLAAAGADAIEVWNEPNIEREWQKGHISPASYTQLLCAAYGAIKRANPNTLVVSAAPAPTGFFGGCTPDGCDDNHWVAGLRDAGAARCMDYVGAHHNAGATSPAARSGHPAGTHYSWYFLPQTELYYRALRKQLFYTEMGYVSPAGYCQIPANFAWGGATTPAQQAQWLAEAASLSARTGMVRVLIVWNVDFRSYDCGPGYGDPQAGYAIIRPDGSCPACDTLHAVLGTR